MTSFVYHDGVGSGLAMFLLALMCYLAGRIQQFYKQTEERESAYRDGYNEATRSLFSVAARTARGLPSSKPPVKMVAGQAAVPTEVLRTPARHRASGRRSSQELSTTKKYPSWPHLDKAA